MSFFNNNNNTGGGGLLGSSNTSTTNSGTTNSTPAANAFGSGAFGAPAGGGLFGGGSNTTGSNIFGGSNTSTKPASTSSGLFGSNTSSATPASTSNLFGSATTSTTPATNAGLFGGSTTTSNTTSTPATGGSLFGNSNTTSTPQTGGNLFGGGGILNASGSNSFGATNTAVNATGNLSTTGTSTLFGGGNVFSLPKPGETTSNAAKPAGTSLFGQPAASTTASTSGPTGTTPAAPLTGSTLFGLPPKPSATSTPTATSAPSNSSGPLFGGGLFGQGSSSSITQPAAATAGSSTTSGGGLFGKPPPTTDDKKDGEKKDTAPAASSTFSLFGKPAAKKDEAAPTEPEKKADATAGTFATPTNAAGANSNAVSVPPPSALRGKTLEEIINKWTGDLETHVREFNKFAAEVTVWDRALIENGNNIAALFSHVLAAERQQSNINEALEHIEQQQKDLGFTLDAYEKASQDILGGQSGSLRTLDTGPADNERDKNYMLATDLHTHLDDLSGSLSQMIESVNGLSLSSKPNDAAEDPMSQIAQILSSHLESLQWIDSAVRDVEAKASDVEKRIKDVGHSTGIGKPRGFGAR